MEKRELLSLLRFGARVAEEEIDNLEQYFVETDQWNRIFTGAVDIIAGPKGSGKSAIYALLTRRVDQLFDRSILLTSAESPRGGTVFNGLVTDPPPNEQVFITLWNLYFLCPIVAKLREYDLGGKKLRPLVEVLEGTGLLTKQPSLTSMFKAVRTYIANWLNPGIATIEYALSYDATTSTPTISRKVSYKDRSSSTSTSSIPIDELLVVANNILISENMSLWILIDRLDVAFSDSQDLEKNALRALFRVYNDMRTLTKVELKIFVRIDIWKRISEGGFREASHITRRSDITWDHNSLLNLVVRRLLNNDAFITHYNIDKIKTLDSFDKQQKIIEMIFPQQIDSGRNPRTFEWIIARTTDASNQPAPREIIHLLEAARDAQVLRVNRGEAEPTEPLLFERIVFKEALKVVSSTRYDQTLLAEYPDKRNLLEALRGGKAEQTPQSLSELWRVEVDKAKDLAKQINEIGFFEIRGTRDEPSYWTPFLYRDALNLTQGKAEALLDT